MRWAALLVGLATTGCHLVFELEDPGVPRCWNAELGDHDEDGDGIADGCDNCPAVQNDDQASMDEDGVGDLCDPRPQDAGDRIAFFDPFESRTESWQPYGDGVWSVSGEARQTDTEQDGTFVLLQDFENATMQTSFTGQTPMAPGDTPSIVGVYVRIPAGQEVAKPIPGVLCHSYRKSGGIILKVEGAPEATPSDFEPFEDGAEVHLQLSARGVCTGRRDELPSRTVEIALTKASGEIGLYTHNSEARFRFVTVIESP
jgi:hypothetical protein